jgi:methylated-DNA-protein-cysteine methyltransferase-like protein
MKLDPLWQLVRAIPEGKCTSYSALGQELPHPATGRMVGKWMASAPVDLPWWRVLAKSGALPISKRDPMLGMTQRELLMQEGVPFSGDLVARGGHWWDPGEARE